MHDNLLISLSSAGGVIVSVLVACIAFYWSSVRNIESAILLAVVSFLAFSTMDSLVLGPIAVIQVADFGPAVLQTVVRWRGELANIIALASLVPFLRVATLIRFEQTSWGDRLQRQLAFHMRDTKRASRWTQRIGITACTGLLYILYLILPWWINRRP